MLPDLVGQLTRMLRNLLCGNATALSQRQASVPQPRLLSTDQRRTEPGTFEGDIARRVVIAARAASGV
jgi:hypothetical protein